MPFIPLEVFANNPSTAVASGGTSAPAQGTVETWTVASSSTFPAVEIGATQFHVADPALPSEVVTVQNITGTTWTVQRGAEGSTPVAHSAGFTVVQVVTAGTLANLAYPPWQFPVQAYGAQGDGKIGTGGTGSAGSSAFSDAGAHFVNAAAPAGDVGKVIIVNQGTSGSGTGTGTNQNPFTGTITAVNSATSVTLSGNLAAATANAPYIYGTDDAAAVNAAVAAAVSWATTTGNYKAQVIFEPQNYMLGALTQATSPNQYNCHIPLPVGTQTGQKLCLDFIGVGDASEPDYWESTVPNLQGTCLVSAVFATGQPDATYGYMSVIGAVSGGLSNNVFTNALLNLSGITIVCPWNAQQWGVDCRNQAQLNIPNASYLAFAPVNLGGATIGGPYLSGSLIVSNGVSTGFAFPTWQNNDNNNIGQLTAEGAYYGVSFTEHVYAARLAMIYCNAGITIPMFTGASIKHSAVIGYYSCEASNWCIQVTNPGAGPVYALNIASMDSESINTGHIYDPDNNLAGVVWWSEEVSTHVVNTGAANLVTVDTSRHFPGPWSGAPAVPASGGTSTNTQQNLAYRNATLYLSATTITAVFTGPAATGLTSLGLTQVSSGPAIAIRVPGGHFWSAAYTGTLTAVWVLE